MVCVERRLSQSLRLGKRGKKVSRTKLSKIMEGSHDEDEEMCLNDKKFHESLPQVAQVNPQQSRFPCCVVWTPLPIVSWLAPFIGHVGICREDGVILDFSGSNFVSVDNFTFGAVARYIQLSKQQCCFPLHLSGHTCKSGYRHTEIGTSLSWDDALHSCTQHYQHKSYNLFTCNCHSFVASCLNRFCYRGSIGWNVITVVLLVILKGQWVNKMAIVRSFAPFTIVMCMGLYMASWPFLVGLALFSLLLAGWFLIGTYCIKSLIEC
ncbi:protein REVERSION-TO-ETHYLENE SENSITIVITY1 [Cryptomeria japonica]|uniref:protein REVERSION-TO-ETHYLENE SENSITIVITY1 n=1 Tax=Cryptomeria japonica TaxID=3369 RepID=UPI0025AD1EEA|nr:protein REVERSION-TO-ETHYLENE SENSITIVITY1 [Cryptomeria japonica]XP_057850356.1 protein REVERSION-TO-ETHYLENE SENSITIVITY1 [Cryptomeria japonica]XP_057850357.1 protein REVERSION-TO-ETHYLENE SENSITIVITY1 [Cryptomeria japonica]